MERYIDATRIEQYILNNCSDNEEINAIYAEIVNAPTVDAVEVVRCKDCIHREVQVDGVFRYEMCGIRSEIINLEGFCHMGERREDAETNRCGRTLCRCKVWRK